MKFAAHVSLALLIAPTVARATTFQVGPSRTDKTLQAVEKKVKAGDVIELDGDATYPGATDDRGYRVSGAAGNPVTIRGIPINNKPPVISGSQWGLILYGNHIVMENVEFTASTVTCLITKGDDIVLRSLRVHDCPSHGLLATDDESGNLTLEYSEFYKNGVDEKKHQIYVATDEKTYPGSTFRMRYNYVHDANGGNNLKSRCERNEIYYNWVQGAAFYELDLIGEYIDDPASRRRDSDVVGNVLLKNDTSPWSAALVGGDADGETKGRVRFVNNTIILGAKTPLAVTVQNRLESLELSNNVFYKLGGAAFQVVKDKNAIWVAGRVVGGSNNWITSSADIPAELTGTIKGTDPGFTDLTGKDFRPAAASALLDKGLDTPPPIAGHEVPKSLVLPAFLPYAVKLAVGGETPRPVVNAIDVGAYEFGSGPPRKTDIGPDGSNGGSGGGTGGGTGSGTGGSSGGSGSADDSGGGCACHTVPVTGQGGWALVGFALGAAGLVRRRRAA